MIYALKFSDGMALIIDPASGGTPRQRAQIEADNAQWLGTLASIYTAAHRSESGL